MNFTKADLTDAKHYSWSASSGDDPALRRVDGQRLNMSEGYEVLAFLNVFAAKVGIKDQQAFRKAETVLWKKPGTIQSREKAMDWLMSQWR